MYREVYIFFFLSNLLQYWSLISICFEVYIVVSNFMESQQDLPYYMGIMNGDILLTHNFWEHLKIILYQFLILHLKLRMSLL